MSLSNSGMKEMSSSQTGGKSYGGEKEGYSFAEGGRTMELNPEVITFEDVSSEVKTACIELARDAFSTLKRR